MQAADLYIAARLAQKLEDLYTRDLVIARAKNGSILLEDDDLDYSAGVELPISDGIRAAMRAAAMAEISDVEARLAAMGVGGFAAMREAVADARAEQDEDADDEADAA